VGNFFPVDKRWRSRRQRSRFLVSDFHSLLLYVHFAYIGYMVDLIDTSASMI